MTASAEEDAALAPAPLTVPAGPARTRQLSLVPPPAAGEPCAQLWAAVHLPAPDGPAQLRLPGSRSSRSASPRG